MRLAAWARIAMAAAAWVPGSSCRGDDGAPDAAAGGDGGAIEDAGPRADANLPLIWIDFSAVGCAARGDGTTGADLCLGAAPLRLQFVPVAPAPVELYEWSFGDGSDPDRRATPDHVYPLPGTYDVSLFAQGPGGTAAAIKDGLVVVSPGPTGNPCSADGQCASGRCVCGPEPCAGLATGFCSAACSGAEPCGDGVCADLARAAPPDGAAWQSRLCLAGCQGASCPDGQVCRELRSGDGAGWVLACFAPGLLGDIGDSCAGVGGEKSGALCASGECLDEGLRGLCGAACANAPCPPSAACATFESGGLPPACLARCDDAGACAADPWLRCEAAGGPGPKGFTVDEPPAEAGYCAPKSCDSPDDCPLGQCANGFCGP